MIKNIIFDLGGVLIDWNPHYVYDDYFNDKDKADYFINNICTLAWNEKHDGGYPIVKGTLELIEQYPDWEDAIRTYYSRWAEMLKSPIQPTVDVLKKLKDTKQYKLLALTNWEATLFQIAQIKYNFLQWFEGIVVSGEEKLIKPDLRLYQVLIDRYKINPKESVFIDDRLSNVEAAEKLNFNGLQFISAEKLENDLKKLGVEI